MTECFLACHDQSAPRFVTAMALFQRQQECDRSGVLEKDALVALSWSMEVWNRVDKAS